MKQLTSILLFLLPALAMAQTFPIAPPKTPINSGTIQLGVKTDGKWYTRNASGVETPFLISPKANGLPITKSMSDVRSLSLTSSEAPLTINMSQGLQSGIFILRAGDTTTPADSAIYVRTAPVTGLPSGLLYERFVQDYYTPEMFGAVGDSLTDDYVALRKAAQFCNRKGKTLLLRSYYGCSQPIVVNLANGTGYLFTGGRRFSMKGIGMSTSGIRWLGGNATVFKLNGTGDDNVELSDFRIFPADVNARVGTGLEVNWQSNFSLSRIHIGFFNRNLNLIDAGEGKVDGCVFDWGNEGVFAGLSSHGVAPNGILFSSTAFNSNGNYGLYIENGCNNTIQTCRFLNNGHDVTKSYRNAFRNQYTSFNGAVSTTLLGNYFEGNRCPTTVEMILGQFDASKQNGGATLIMGNTFNRIGKQGDIVNDIKFRPLNLINNGPIQAITMVGNSFTGYPIDTVTYVSSPTKPRVAYDIGLNAFNNYVIFDMNYYMFPNEAPVETPGYVRHKYRLASDQIDYVTELKNKPTIPTTAAQVGAVSLTNFDSYTTTQQSLDVSQNTAISNNTNAITSHTNTLTLHTSQINSVSTAIGNKLDISTYTTYSATTASLIADKVAASTYSSYTASVGSQLASKLDISTFTSYSAATVTLIADKVTASTYSSYTAGVASTLSGKLDISTFTSYSAGVATALTGKISSTAGTGVSTTLTTPTLLTLTASGLATMGAITASGDIIRTGYQTTESQLKVGSLEAQSISLNSAFVGENIFFNGTGFQRRATGPGAIIYFAGSEIQFRFAVSNTAGTTSGGMANNAPFKVTVDGKWGFGSTLTWIPNTFTNAKVSGDDNGMYLSVPMTTS
ncbi:hypothetical protein IC229_33115, partial [Spirosoma sp. BT702]